MRTVNPKKLASAIAHYEGSKKPNIVISSQKYGIGYETLRRHLKGQGIPTAKRVRVSTPNKSEYKRKNPNPSNASKRWSADSDEMLKQAVESKMSVRDTCDLLGRSVASVYARKCILLGNGYIEDETRFQVEKGILRPRKNFPSDDEIEAAIEELEVKIDELESIYATQPTPEATPSTLEFSMTDLASLVNQFGVSVTVTMREGNVTEVGIYK
jgi:hypothetical protein